MIKLSVTIGCLLLLQICLSVFSQQPVLKTEGNKMCIDSVTTSKPLLKVIKINCTESESCYVLTFLEARFFKNQQVITAVKSISKDYNSKKGVTIWVFDDEELANSFASGKREFVNLASDARGKYVRGGNQEILLYSPNERRLGELNDVVIIDFNKDPK